eukprot:1967822-Rhodomonas_salina.1
MMLPGGVLLRCATARTERSLVLMPCCQVLCCHGTAIRCRGHAEVASPLSAKPLLSHVRDSSTHYAVS